MRSNEQYSRISMIALKTLRCASSGRSSNRCGGDASMVGMESLWQQWRWLSEAIGKTSLASAIMI